MATMNPRFTVTVTDEMLKKIDNFRYETRYPTRTQAVNELLRIGLEDIEKKEYEKIKRDGRSNIS